MNHGLTFPKRIPEPRDMGAIEQKVFFDLSLKNYKRWFIPLVDDIHKHINFENKRILDIASGPGLLAKEMGTRFRKSLIFGVDTSSHAVRFARLSCRNLKNVTFKIASAYKIPFPDKSMDLVVCKDSLHQFNYPERALREMFRVLKPGCSIYIQDLRRDLPFYLLKRSIPPKTTLQKLQYYSVRAAFTKDEARKLIQKVCINPRRLRIRTRKLTPHLVRKYSKIGVDSKLLREGFQARFVAVFKK